MKQADSSTSKNELPSFLRQTGTPKSECTPQHRQAVWIIATLCVTAVTIAGVLYHVMGNPFDPFDDSRFSVEAWRTADETSRAEMVRDAIRHHLVAGLTEIEVASLLGAPGDTIRGADAGGNKLAGAKTYSYPLGCWSWYGFDSTFLYIHFDETGRVISAEINGY